MLLRKSDSTLFNARLELVLKDGKILSQKSKPMVECNNNGYVSERLFFRIILTYYNGTLLAYK